MLSEYVSAANKTFRKFLCDHIGTVYCMCRGCTAISVKSLSIISEGMAKNKQWGVGKRQLQESI
jgi:hypothetical protein